MTDASYSVAAIEMKALCNDEHRSAAMVEAIACLRHLQESLSFSAHSNEHRSYLNSSGTLSAVGNRHIRITLHKEEMSQNAQLQLPAKCALMIEDCPNHARWHDDHDATEVACDHSLRPDTISEYRQPPLDVLR